MHARASDKYAHAHGACTPSQVDIEEEEEDEEDAEGLLGTPQQGAASSSDSAAALGAWEAAEAEAQSADPASKRREAILLELITAPSGAELEQVCVSMWGTCMEAQQCSTRVPVCTLLLVSGAVCSMLHGSWIEGDCFFRVQLYSPCIQAPGVPVWYVESSSCYASTSSASALPILRRTMSRRSTLAIAQNQHSDP